MTYRIIKSPIEMTYDFIEFIFIQGNWWLLGLIPLSYLVQIVLCFLNESSLAMGIISERLGMALHLFISLFSFNLCSIMFTIYKFNPVAGVAAMAHLLPSVKFWGYAYENKKLREAYKRTSNTANFGTSEKVKSNVVVKKTVKYPDNVTLKKTFQFIACTGACTYTINGPLRKSTKFEKVFKAMFLSIFNYYAVMFLIYQCMFPEIDKTVKYIDQGQYLNLFGSVLKLALPVNVGWLLFCYFNILKFYLPIFGWFWGTEDIVITQDWWNSENSTIFWTKWNYQIHLWLKECFFLPLIRMGYGKRTASFIAASISGLLHEYMITIPCRCCYGGGTLAMLLQIPMALITTHLQRNFGAKWGNLGMWSNFIFGLPMCGILLYYNYTPSQK